MIHPATAEISTASNSVLAGRITRKATFSSGVISDADLLKVIGSGDEKAMKIFYNRHSNFVFQFAVKMIRNPHDAADVLNEVMLDVWRKPSGFQGRSKVSTWLLGITHHKVVDLVRKNARNDNNVAMDLELIPSQQESLSNTLAKDEDAQRMRDCISRLPIIHRQVIQLAFYGELSYPEIAKLLEVPTGTVKTRMMHAKNNLLKVMKAVQFC